MNRPDYYDNRIVVMKVNNFVRVQQHNPTSVWGFPAQYPPINEGTTTNHWPGTQVTQNNLGSLRERCLVPWARGPSVSWACATGSAPAPLGHGRTSALIEPTSNLFGFVAGVFGCLEAWRSSAFEPSVVKCCHMDHPKTFTASDWTIHGYPWEIINT